MSSANASTSAGSWVMSRIGSDRRACSSASSARRRLRSGSSSAANGSSRRSARGSRGERAGERDALALAARQLVGKARRERAQLERVEPAIDRLRRRRRGPGCASRGRGRRRRSGARSGAETARTPGTGSRSRARARAGRSRPRGRTAWPRPCGCVRRRAAAGRRSPSASASCRHPTDRTGPAARRRCGTRRRARSDCAPTPTDLAIATSHFMSAPGSASARSGRRRGGRRCTSPR